MVVFLGIIGTIIGFICLTGFIIFINDVIFQTLTLTECLMISSVLCATDTVAAMSLIKVTIPDNKARKIPCPERSTFWRGNHQ